MNVTIYIATKNRARFKREENKSGLINELLEEYFKENPSPEPPLKGQTTLLEGGNES